MSEGQWVSRAACRCGFTADAAFGDIWFARKRYPVCPRCGASSSAWAMRIMRWPHRQWPYRSRRYQKRAATRRLAEAST